MSEFYLYIRELVLILCFFFLGVIVGMMIDEVIEVIDGGWIVRN